MFPWILMHILWDELVQSKTLFELWWVDRCGGWKPLHKSPHQFMNHHLEFFITSSPLSEIPSLKVHSVCFGKLTYKQMNPPVSLSS